MASFAIIGAGIAGLSCGSRLRDVGHDVFLFDRAKSAGGRMASVWLEIGDADVCLDLGASHFTVRSHDFREAVAAWHDAGLAERWPAAGADNWVGIPSMSAPIEDAAALLDVRWNCGITHISGSKEEWHVHSSDDIYGPFDAILAATPADTVAKLFARHERTLADRATKQETHAIWTASYVFAEKLEKLPDFKRLDGAITYVVREASKPGRADVEVLTIQASWEWSARHIDAPVREVAARLFEVFANGAGRAIATPIYSHAHRW